MIRILQVVGGMNQGGTEAWLMQVLRHIDRDRFHLDFLVHTAKPCAYDDEIKVLGSRVIPCLDPSKPWLFAKNFKRILQTYEPYNIIHSHLHHYSGFVLRLAHEMGIPVRIAHSHSDTTCMDSRATLLRRAYLRLMEYWITYYATAGLATSKKAASCLFGSNWQINSRWQVFYCGIDLNSFRESLEPNAVRAELGIDPDAWIMGHVGRLVEVKNHQFLLEVVAEVVKRDPKAHLLLVGDGSLRSALEKKVIELGLSQCVTFTGARNDIPQIMRGAIDVFVFPSLYEGLGMVLIEAQAAGCPCVISDRVPNEATIVSSLVKRLSLAQDAATWATSILASKNDAIAVDREKVLNTLNSSQFNIEKSIKELESNYLSYVDRSIAFLNHL